jgi:hypothetical protein
LEEDSSGMKPSKRITFPVLALMLAMLACTQAGEILTPEEATRRAQIIAEATMLPTAISNTSGIEIGLRVRFDTIDYLVLMKREPGSALISVQSERGATGIVVGSQDVDGMPWYQIETPGGTGWLPGDILTVVGGEGLADLAEGDTAYLIGTSEIVKLLVAPGNNLGAKDGAAGSEVTVLQITQFEGEQWVKVRVPAGEGWVRSSNLSLTAP